MLKHIKKYTVNRCRSKRLNNSSTEFKLIELDVFLQRFENTEYLAQQTKERHKNLRLWNLKSAQ